MISLSYTFDRVGFPRFGKEKYLKSKKKEQKKNKERNLNTPHVTRYGRHMPY
jgi:hypothetical protein